MAKLQMKKPMLTHGFLNMDCYSCYLNSSFQNDLSGVYFK